MYTVTIMNQPRKANRMYVFKGYFGYNTPPKCYQSLKMHKNTNKINVGLILQKPSPTPNFLVPSLTNNLHWHRAILLMIRVFLT